VVLDPGDIARDRQESPAELFDFAFDFEEPFLGVPGLEDDVDPGDVETFARQCEDDAPADALPCARDDSDGGPGPRFILFLGHA
jgi:hypothetical protein